MTTRRAVLYIGGASLLVAWLSSAASVSLNRGGSPVADPVESPIPVEQLAGSVQQQARRLRERLAANPRAPEPRRNPFAFHQHARRAEPITRVEPAAVPAGPVEPPEPRLSLIGVAEHARPQGLVRTALLATGGDELIIAAPGEDVLRRYRVSAVSADTVELLDLTTGRVRRLSLQIP